MSSKLILTVTIAVTSEEPIDSKFYIDPADVQASDVIYVECPFNIDAKALDISKVIQGTLPGVIEEHKERRYAERERLRALTQPSLLTLAQDDEADAETMREAEAAAQHYFDNANIPVGEHIDAAAIPQDVELSA